MPMRATRLSRLLTALSAALMAACAATGAAPPTDAPASAPAEIPAWLLDHMKSQVGRWETPNAAYKSEDEPFDTYGLVWSWGVGKTSLAGTLYGRVGEGDNVEFWNFRIYWHPGTREARVDQWGHGGALLSGTLRPHGQEDGADVFELEQTWYATSGKTARTRHRTLHRDEVQTGWSYDWKDGEWVRNREYTWRRIAG
jgi:hypothetical protein